MTAADTDLVAWLDTLMADRLITPNLRTFAIAAIWDLRNHEHNTTTPDYVAERAAAPEPTLFTPRRARRVHWVLSTMWLMSPNLRTEEETWRAARGVIAEDVPRYESPRRSMYDDWQCLGFYDRAPTTPCRNKDSRRSETIYHPLTGETITLDSCRNPRHRAELERRYKEGIAAWRANGCPKPKNNTGGRLPKHLSYSGWDHLYEWASWGRYKPGVTSPAGAQEPTDTLAKVTPLFALRATTDTGIAPAGDTTGGGMDTPLRPV